LAAPCRLKKKIHKGKFLLEIFQPILIVNQNYGLRVPPWSQKKKFWEAIIFLDIFSPLLLNVGILLTLNHLFEKGG